MKWMKYARGATLMLMSFAAIACSRSDAYADDFPAPEHDESLVVLKEKAEGEDTGTDKAESEDKAQDKAQGKAKEPDPAAPRKIVLAGGCFWCVEAVYEQIDGILDVESGYAGGSAETANYQAVSTGRTKHAEVVRITYDPTKITYGTILKVFFSTAHDPTTLNRQGADVGPQYRSAIFFDNDKHLKIAKDYIKQLNDAEVYRDPIVTTLEPLEAYYPAENYHQDYAKENPDNGYIRGVSKPKVDKTREKHPELIRDGDGDSDDAEDADAE